MAGQMFDNREHSALEQTAGRLASPDRNVLSAPAQGAVADNRMGVRLRNIQQRDAIHVDAQRCELGGDRPVAQPECLENRHLGALLSQIPDRVPALPVRRTQAGDAASLLIDQDRSVAAHGLAHRAGQGANLLGRVHIAGEEDKAPGLRLGQEVPLLGRQFQPRDAKDDRALSHWW